MCRSECPGSGELAGGRRYRVARSLRAGPLTEVRVPLVTPHEAWAGSLEHTNNIGRGRCNGGGGMAAGGVASVRGAVAAVVRWSVAERRRESGGEAAGSSGSGGPAAGWRWTATGRGASTAAAGRGASTAAVHGRGYGLRALWSVAQRRRESGGEAAGSSGKAVGRRREGSGEQLVGDPRLQQPRLQQRGR